MVLLKLLDGLLHLLLTFRNKYLISLCPTLCFSRNCWNVNCYVCTFVVIYLRSCHIISRKVVNFEEILNFWWDISSTIICWKCNLRPIIPRRNRRNDLRQFLPFVQTHNNPKQLSILFYDKLRISKKFLESWFFFLFKFKFSCNYKWSVG